MKRFGEIIRKKEVAYTLFAVGGFLVGGLLFGTLHTPRQASTNHVTADGTPHSNHGSAQADTVWTCSMHPQIRKDKPGKCPICAMDLIPLKQTTGKDTTATDSSAIQLSEEAMALADVQTSRVSRKNPIKNIRLYGKITPDERSLQSQTAYVGGRIEKLAVEFTGEQVRAGQSLATLYSPELFTAQQELLQAIKMGQPSLVQAAKEKLCLWNMTEAQIDAIQQSGKASPTVDIKANTSGIVLAKRVNRGDYVSQGAVLFDIANLSHVWAMFDAFEVDLPFLNKGDRVEFTLPSFPGKKFAGTIAFIDPIIDPTTRTARVRVEVANPQGEMKPEMYATAEVNAPMKGYKDRMVIPQTAVLWTGKRSLVYVRQADRSIPTFLPREVELGPSLGGSYVVMNGLAEGEEVVTNGVFSIDASAQLAGKPSMMNREQLSAVEEVHPTPNMAGMTGLPRLSDEQKTSTKHAMFTVKGECGQCKDRIEKAAMGVKGVQSAQWDKDKQMIHLNFDPSKTSEDAIRKAIAKAGHDTDKYKAPDSVYNQLPACCKYRK